MNPAEVLAWRKRRTSRWAELSLAACGLMVDIDLAQVLDERGEVSLWRGLPSLAKLLGRAWEECEAPLRELLESGALAYDEERRVLHDPDPKHRERQAAAAALAAENELLRARVRELEMELVETPAIPIYSYSAHPEAVRSRTRRKSVENAQGVLFDTQPVTRPVTMTGHGSPPPPDQRSKIRKEAKPARVEHDPDHPPPWAFEAARVFRSDLSEHLVRQLWWKFAKKKRSHKSEDDAQLHFARWLEKERTSPPPSQDAPESREASSPPDDANEPPKTQQRPAEDEQQAVWNRTRARMHLLDPMTPIETTRELAKAALADLERVELEPPLPRSMSA